MASDVTQKQSAETIAAYLQRTGMTDPNIVIRDLEDGTWVAAKPLIFHWTVLRGEWDDFHGYFDRWCYANQEKALAALHSFPLEAPLDWEPTGWHRHPGTERRNPITP